jgi:16S rRNA (adenine1518-N6/adenine1519-N6)-dimethyltransferase
LKLVAPEPTVRLPALRDIIARYSLRADKRLGQHFLLDQNLTGRIARAALPFAGRTVYEVGPGPGGLTRALLAQGARVLAVERDRRCLDALKELQNAYPGRLQVIEGDALSVDEASLIAPPAKVVANLPYNIATALVLKWLDRPRLFESYTLMFQKEVAERLASSPGSKTYGRLSVLCQWLCSVRLLFDVHPRAFTPAPKVYSTLIELRPRSTVLAPAVKADLEKVTAAAFGQRRKMLRASLKALGLDPLALLAQAKITPTRRAEDLSVEEFCRLAQAYRARAGA